MTSAKDYDNRDTAEMYAYLEDRIESMKRRIRELEAENRDLRRLDPNANLGAVEKG